MKILIVDDEKDFVYFLKENLGHMGYSADAAYDGKEALELIQSKGYGLVFLDVNMPGLTGLELVRYIKENKIKSKVIIVTGYEEMRESLAKALGADEYLTKPIATLDIEKIIKKYGAAGEKTKRGGGRS